MTKAITKGDAVTKLSMFVMGLGNLAHKQIVKGILFLAVEIAYLLFMIEGGINNLYHLITLGGRAQEEVWNEAKGIYEYTGGDMTILFLLYGVATIFITVLFFMIWRVNMKSAYEVECRAKEGKHINTIKEDLEALVDKRLHWTLLTLPILGIVIFTILPLVFMICMAFTSYSKVGDHLTNFSLGWTEKFQYGSWHGQLDRQDILVCSWMDPDMGCARYLPELYSWYDSCDCHQS